MGSSGRFGLRLLLLASITVACGGSNVGGDSDGALVCTDDDQCPVGQLCQGGFCGVPLDAGPTLDARPGPAEIVVTPTTLDFGSALLGVDVTLTVEITNVGESTLHVTNLELRENDTLPEYDGTPLGPVNLAVLPGSSTIVTITLRQEDAETDLGELRISSSDDDEPLVIVSLESELKGTPQLQATPAAIDYGVVDWGTMPSADVDVQNVGTGNSPLIISNASVTNDTGMGAVYSVEAFLVDPVTGAELAVTLPQFLGAADAFNPADTLRLRVTFDTTTVGSGPIPDEDLVLATNDADPADMQKHIPIMGDVLGCAAPETELCDGIDNDCDLMTDEDDAGGGGGCFTGVPGSCANGTLHCMAGALVCVDNGGPSPEVCDNLDNDCDGSADEALVQSCSTACGLGVEFCVTGTWLGCNAPAPQPENCDGVDNDCDGTTDEGDPGSGASCVTMQPGVCNPGTQHCVGGGLACVRNTDPSPETCDGLDNDCDASSDEGDPGSGAACTSTALGVCQPGTQHCVTGAISCVPNLTPTAETCNALDDDCDGVADDGDPGSGAACSSSGLGICQPGTQHCVGGAVSCVSNLSPGLETCNGLDDDCDGAVDDGDPGSGASCATFLPGVCSVGVNHCVSGGIQCVANVSPGTQVETCDGLDNDCDGGADEGNPGGGAACVTGQPGVCSPGTQQCVSGALSCVRNVNPSTESCDGLDNDCDSTTDEGFGLGSACDGGDSDLCTEGTTICAMDGSATCSDATGNTLDTCNGLNDDCNAATPDGADEALLGTACDGSDGDLCNEGTRVCTAGSLICNDANDADPDVCNGADDDCNGATADGAGDSLLGTVCDGTDADLCTEGTRVCTAGSLACTDTNDLDPDVCNGADDDCNAATADGSGDPLLGTVCDGTDVDLCTEGARVCTAGSLTCNDANDADPDICNGANDDCNGATADGSGDPGLGVACDGTDADLCTEGTQVCTTGSLVCNDANDADPDICNGADDDCNSGTVDGSGDPAVGVACDGTDTDLCNEGLRTCTSGALACNDANDADPDVCNGADDDCNAATADGSGDSAVGTVCDGVDGDLCTEGTRFCSAGSLACNDPNDVDLDLCNGADDDCNAGTADGSGDPGLGALCDGTDTDLCAEGTRFCSGGSLLCSDSNDADPDLCNGADDDCNSATADGSADPLVGTGCDGIDADLCVEGARFCSGGALQCDDPNDVDAEVCNGFDDNCMGGIDEGSLCPLTSQVSSTTCSGACAITGCNGGWYNVDGSYPNGCECGDEGYAADCSLSSSIGSLNAGTSTTVGGRLPFSGASDWFVVSFPENYNYWYHGTGDPQIYLSYNPGDQFRFRVYLGSCGAGAACGSDLNDWYFIDNQSGGLVANNYSTRNIAWPTTVYVQVFRRAGYGVTCEDYNLTFRR